MTDAGGTNEVRLFSDAGIYPVYIVVNTEVTNGETIPVDGTNGVPGIQAEDTCIVLGGMNLADETSISGGTISAEYDKTAMHFTVTDAGASDDPVCIIFMHVPVTDDFIGDL